MADVLRQPLTSSRLTRATTVTALATWWLESVAGHQVKTSTFDSYKKFTGYLVDELGSLAVVDVGPETLTADDARSLATATGQVRNGTAVTLLFVQGWA